MIQPKYNPREALKQIKLMMKYDTSKTLNENKQTILEEEAEPATMENLINHVNGAGNDKDKVITFFYGCKLLKDKLNPTDETYKSDISLLRGNITKLVVYKTLEKLKTIDDLCAMGNSYGEQYGDFHTAIENARRKYQNDDDYNKFLTFISGFITDKINKLGLSQNRTETTYTICPDTFPIKYRCKNETIRKIQSCIGESPDSAFGPNTLATLEKKGQKGNIITQETYNAVCGGGNTNAGNDTKEITGYEDYTTDEIEDETQNSNNTGYEGYGQDSGVEGDEPAKTTTTPNTTTTTQTPSSKNNASINVQPWSEFVKEKTKSPKFVGGFPQK